METYEIFDIAGKVLYPESGEPSILLIKHPELQMWTAYEFTEKGWALASDAVLADAMKACGVSDEPRAGD